MNNTVWMLIGIAALVAVVSAFLYAVTGSWMPVIFTSGTTAVGLKWYLKTSPPVKVVPLIALNGAIGFLTWMLTQRFAA